MKKLTSIILFLTISVLSEAQTVPYINIERYRNATVDFVFVIKQNNRLLNYSTTDIRFEVSDLAGATPVTLNRTAGVTNLDTAQIRALFTTAQIKMLARDVYNYRLYKVVSGVTMNLCTGQFRLINNPSASGAPPANIIVVNLSNNTATTTTGITTGITSETDPTVPLYIKQITQNQISNWGTAYSWGNHAAMGYLTSTALQQGISNKMNYSDSILFARKTILPFYLLKSDTTGKWKPASYVPSWSQVTSKPSFATVATSGSYTDLSNKPTIPTVPTTVSSFSNDVGYITNSALSPYLTSSLAASTYLTQANAISNYLSKSAYLADSANFLRKNTAAATYQPKGNYQPVGNYQKVQEIDQPDGIFSNIVIRNTTSGEILRLWIGGDTTDTGPNKFKMYVNKGAFSGVNDWRMFDVEGARYQDENLYGVTVIDSSTTQVISSVTYRIYIQKFAISKISLGDQDSAGTGRRLIFNYPANWVFVEQKRWKKKI